MDREFSHAKFRVLRKFLAHQRYTMWTLAGGDPLNRGAPRNFPQRNLTRREIPPSPCTTPLLPHGTCSSKMLAQKSKAPHRSSRAQPLDCPPVVQAFTTAHGTTAASEHNTLLLPPKHNALLLLPQSVQWSDGADPPTAAHRCLPHRTVPPPQGTLPCCGPGAWGCGTAPPHNTLQLPWGRARHCAPEHSMVPLFSSTGPRPVLHTPQK